MIAGKKRRILVTLLVVALISYGLSVKYVLTWNPEIRFWKEAARYKIEEVAAVRSELQQPVTLCFGGSTTSFGIDGGHASYDLNYPLVNLGLHAGMGAEVLSGFALSVLQPGDTLLVMLEPHLIVADDPKTPLGMQFSYSMKQPEFLSWRSHDREPGRFLGSLSNLRPGALNVFSMAGKWCLDRPIYRYAKEDLQRGGLIITDVRNKLAGRRSVPNHLPPQSRELLEGLASAAKDRGAHVLYCLPWAFFDPSAVDQVRRDRVSFLKEVEKVMPVLWERELGVHTVREDFGDTPQHLTQEGAKKRTARLVRALWANIER